MQAGWEQAGLEAQGRGVWTRRGGVGRPPGQSRAAAASLEEGGPLAWAPTPPHSTGRAPQATQVWGGDSQGPVGRGVVGRASETSVSQLFSKRASRSSLLLEGRSGGPR